MDLEDPPMADRVAKAVQYLESLPATSSKEESQEQFRDAIERVKADFGLDHDGLLATFKAWATNRTAAKKDETDAGEIVSPDDLRRYEDLRLQLLAYEEARKKVSRQRSAASSHAIDLDGEVDLVEAGDRIIQSIRAIAGTRPDPDFPVTVMINRLPVTIYADSNGSIQVVVPAVIKFVATPTSR